MMKNCMLYAVCVVRLEYSIKLETVVIRQHYWHIEGVDTYSFTSSISLLLILSLYLSTANNAMNYQEITIKQDQLLVDRCA